MRIRKSWLSASMVAVILCLSGVAWLGCASGSEFTGDYDVSPGAEDVLGDTGYEGRDTYASDTAVAEDSSVRHDTTAPMDTWESDRDAVASDVSSDMGAAEEIIEEPDPQAGQITAAEWDDNLNFQRFVDYANDFVQSMPGMAFLPIADRIIFDIRGSDGFAMSSARVQVSGQDGTVLDVRTRPNGQAIFFPAREGVTSIDGLTVSVTGAGGSGTFEGPLAVENGYAVIQLDVPGNKPAGLDLAFVVDATGSMTDELSFLKSEISDIVSAVQAVDEQMTLRFSLIVYRDTGDDYVTRVFDFTESLLEFQSNLGKQAPGGGGDYEEAVQEAYKKMNALSWRDGNVARVAFHMADAPAHTQDTAALLAEVEVARKKGIGIYPVAASGVAEAAQYLMRMAAQSTLARYLFITDDSGIGGGHAGGEPTIATTCMQVQYLNDLIKRLLKSELAGDYIPPTDNEILREVGDPTDGVCVFDDGSIAILWL